MNAPKPTILIGGASHVGKSTLGAALGQALACEVFATDKMARHPGRPWPTTRPHVAEFYSAMSPDSIFTFLLHHHENMWPGIKQKVVRFQRIDAYHVIEGSALRPAYLAQLSEYDCVCVCLHAPEDVLRRRIHENSGYADMDALQRSLVDTFLERTITDNEAYRAAAHEWGISDIDVSDQDALRCFQTELLTKLGRGPSAQ